MTRSFRAPRHPRRDRGTTLIIAIVLLLVLSLITGFSVTVGITEQRASAADFRHKVVNKVADAALNHAVEFMRLRVATLVPRAGQPVDNAFWQLCTAADTSFPCGTIPAQKDVNGDGVLDPYRAMHYRFIGGIDLDGAGGADAMETRMLPFSFDPATNQRQAVAQVDDFPVQYGVGALMCRIDSTTPAAQPARCTVTAANTTNSNAFVFAARALMPGEGASATLVETDASYRVVAVPPNVPPLVASGLVNGIGSATVVMNPNSAGFGVPVSVWSRQDFNPDNGTWQTCQLGEWLYSFKGQTGQIEATDIELVEGVPVCRTGCGCPADAIVSERGIESYDIIDNEPEVEGVNLDQPNFPCDLFRYVFGVPARQDLNGDGFCETHINTSVEVPDVPDVVEFLQANAREIGATPPQENADDDATLLVSCANLNANSRGLYWAPNGCALRQIVGSPTAPVMIVVDQSFKLNAGAEVFGLIYVRAPETVSSVATGGSASYEPGGGTGQIYGAIVIEGDGTPNGSIDIIASPKVLENLGGLAENTKFGKVPGSWTDGRSY